MAPPPRRHALVSAGAALACAVLFALPLASPAPAAKFDLSAGGAPAVAAAIALGPTGLAVVALLSALVFAAAVARLADRRTAAYAAIVFATSPLVVVEAAARSGAIVATSAHAVAFAGLSLVLFEGDIAFRALGAGLAAVGVVGGSVACGPWLGVAAPLAGAALAGLVSFRSWSSRGDRRRAIVGALALVVAAIAAYLAPAVKAGAPKAAFDEVAHQLGHALFPWSALAPLAIVAVLAPRRDDDADDQQLGAAAASFALAAAALHALGEGGTTTPFIAMAPIAVAIALGLRELDGLPTLAKDRTAVLAARAATGASAVLLLVLAHDLKGEPKRLFAPIAAIRAHVALPADARRVFAAAILFGAYLVFSAIDGPKLLAAARRDVRKALGIGRGGVLAAMGALAVLVAALDYEPALLADAPPAASPNAGPAARGAGHGR